MEHEARIGENDFSLNESRLETLRNNPTHDLTRQGGHKIYLLLEREGKSWVAFSYRVDAEGIEHTRGAVAAEKEHAVEALGDVDISDYYFMRTTGKVPRRLRIYKSDSF